MLNFNPDDDVQTNLLNMMKAADNVTTGSVTFAVRDSDYSGRSIKEGDILALENGKVIFSDSEVKHAVVKLTKSIVNTRRITGRETSFITLIYGKDVKEAEAEEVLEALQERYGNSIDITLVNGGQPVYYYFISVE